MSTSMVMTALLALLLLTLVETVVGLDDALHQRMAHHVLGLEVGKADALDVLEYLHDVGQTRARAAGQVDLADAPGAHGSRAEPDPRAEHLHLFQGGVLTLIEDDEAVVQRAAAHVG